MNDRQLLENAAKAAGLKRAEYWCAGGDNGFPFAECITHYIDGEPCVQAWNPLRDDGDALRLSVKLKIKLLPENRSYARVESKNLRGVGEDWGDDPCAATRRAIVRVAAEIGAAIPVNAAILRRT